MSDEPTTPDQPEPDDDGPDTEEVPAVEPDEQ